ncbi:GroES-like protein [Aspergillus ellipticus CBS 707.79]|uniref:GroES-like protein n=1 Tax=Aspergillus ellipticus CBS 707.79 TaxID=1448320 RepID=A0A319ECF6_9EURO|nr:GroES-like protein [Aspergillus ellipticus CBS 707.79]
MGSHSLPHQQAAITTPVVGTTMNLRYTQDRPVLPPRDGETDLSTDVLFSTGPLPGYAALNHIAGHEGIGLVAESSDPARLGKAVAMRYMASHCGQCSHCRRGVVESCAQQKNFPKHYNGAFQEYMAVPWTSVDELPPWVFDESCSDRQSMYTAALCSGSTALRSLEAAAIKPGDVVVVLGIFGASGHLTGMLAKAVFQAKGSMEWYRDELAKACETARAGQLTSDLRMPDAIIVATSSSVAYQGLHQCIRDGGSVICLRAPKGPCSIVIPARELMERQLRFQGSMMGGFGNAMRVMKLIRDGIILPQIEVIQLEQVPPRLQDILDGKVFGKLAIRNLIYDLTFASQPHRASCDIADSARQFVVSLNAQILAKVSHDMTRKPKAFVVAIIGVIRIRCDGNLHCNHVLHG